MLLSDLHPTMTGDMGNGVLEFDCPGHPEVRVTVPFRHQRPGFVGTVYHWQATGSFPDTLTVMPSIDFNQAKAAESGDAADAAPLVTWHGFITRGEVTDA